MMKTQLKFMRFCFARWDKGIGYFRLCLCVAVLAVLRTWNRMMQYSFDVLCVCYHQHGWLGLDKDVEPFPNTHAQAHTRVTFCAKHWVDCIIRYVASSACATHSGPFHTQTPGSREPTIFLSVRVATTYNSNSFEMAMNIDMFLSFVRSAIINLSFVLDVVDSTHGVCAWRRVLRMKN